MRTYLSLLTIVLAVVVTAGVVFAQPQTPPTYLYLATRNLDPGPIFRLQGAGEVPILTRPAHNLTSFTFGPRLSIPTTNVAPPSTQIYYCDAVNEMQIFRAGEVPIYTNKTYIREVAFGPGPALYFSESSGAGGDGKIYKLSPAMTPELYYTVRLSQVGGFWAGHFTFTPGGSLYIANGNETGAKIWRCSLDTAPVAVYSARNSILGFWVADDGQFWFTNGSPRLYRGVLGGAAPSVIYTSPKRNNYCDVVVSTQSFGDVAR